ncbi:beta strand repeat-containing protein [Bradyrhizobium sp. USDA 4529]
MALQLLWDQYQTYQTGTAFDFSPSALTVSYTAVNGPTGPRTYTINTSGGVHAVLLTPDISYVPELNKGGVGGVFTILTVTPGGSIVGQAVTETVRVGTFAYLGTAASIEASVYNYAVGNALTYEYDALTQIDQAIQGLCAGSSTSQMASKISSAIASTGDANFAALAQPLVGVANNWQNPIYTLTTANGTSTQSGLDPAGFGVDLLTVNGASATWTVNGTQGSLTVSGYTAYSTYNSANQTILVNIANADASGDLSIAYQQTPTSSQIKPISPIDQIAGSSGTTVFSIGLSNGNFLVNWGGAQQLFGPSGAPIGASTSTAFVNPAFATLTNGSYVVSSDGSVGGLSDIVVSVGGGSPHSVFTPSASEVGSHSGITGTANGGYAVAWFDEAVSAANQTLKVQLFNSAQTALTGQITLTPAVFATGISSGGLTGPLPDSSPALTQLKNGNLAVVWNNHQDPSQVSGNLDLAILTSAGAVVTNKVLGSIFEPTAPDVAALNDGNFVVVWNTQGAGGPTIVGQLLDPAGNLLGNQFAISSPTDFVAYGETPKVVALSNGDFVVEWGPNVHIQVFEPNGWLIGAAWQETSGRDHTTYGDPTLTALAGGEFSVAWQDLALSINSNHIETSTHDGVRYQVFKVGLPAASDFNRDGVSDVLFRDDSTGDTGFYQLNNDGSFGGWHDIAGSSTAYSVVGVGHFNGNGVSDVLFRNNTTGDTGFYQMNSNGTFQGWHDIAGSSKAYSVVGVGDFNSDGISDVLFRNNSTGDTGFYQLNSNGTFQGWHPIAGSSTAYSVVGVGDFNGNGVSDVLFRNNVSGDTGFYQLNNDGSFGGWHDVAGSSTAYGVVGVGDFNGDGVSDVLFRNNTTGDIGFYQLSNNGTFQAWHDIAGSSTAYSVAGVGDYNGDGISDVLFRNNSTGDTGFYQLNSSGTFQGWHDIAGSSTGYHVFV